MVNSQGNELDGACASLYNMSIKYIKAIGSNVGGENENRRKLLRKIDLHFYFNSFLSDTKKRTTFSYFSLEYKIEFPPRMHTVALLLLVIRKKVSSN